MDAPMAEVRVGACDVLVIGTITGFVPEADRVRLAFDQHRPDLVALGIPPEDVAGLELLATAPDSFKDMAPPDDLTGRRLELLKPFGDIRIPSPDLDAAFAAAKAHSVPVDTLDLDDKAYSDEYTRRVKFRHVVQTNVQRKRLLKRGFKAPDAYAMDEAWDSAVNGIRPLRELEAVRETTMASRIRALAGSSKRMIAIVPAARFAGVLAALRRPATPPQN